MGIFTKLYSGMDGYKKINLESSTCILCPLKFDASSQEFIKRVHPHPWMSMWHLQPSGNFKSVPELHMNPRKKGKIPSGSGYLSTPSERSVVDH